MSHVDVALAKSQLKELVEQVLRGEEVVITREDRPVVRLEVVPQKHERQFGSLHARSG